MGKRLDDFRTQLDDATERFIFDGDCHGHDYVEVEHIEDAFKEIERHISGKPGDPGPLYKLTERVRRVIYELKD